LLIIEEYNCYFGLSNIFDILKKSLSQDNIVKCGGQLMEKYNDVFQILRLDERSVNLGEVISSKVGSRVIETLFKDAGRIGVSASEISYRIQAPRTTILHHLYKLIESEIVEVNPLISKKIYWKEFWTKVSSLRLSKEEIERLRRAKQNFYESFHITYALI